MSPVPLYRSYRLGLATPREIGRLLADSAPDLVHLAGPAVLGRAAAWAARRLGLPIVAVFQIAVGDQLLGFYRQVLTGRAVRPPTREAASAG